MDPNLALSLMSNNNAAPAHEQPGNGQPAATTLSTTIPQTTNMDPDLARSLLQNNNTSASDPSYSRPKQPTKHDPTPKRPTNPDSNTIPHPPPFPILAISAPFTPCPPSSRQRQKLLKKLYPTPGLQPRDYTNTFLHPAGYVAFDLRKNPRGLPYPWCEFCRGDCWCVDRNRVFRMPERGGFGCGCGVM
jgi:hypothetical protein